MGDDERRTFHRRQHALVSVREIGENDFLKDKTLIVHHPMNQVRKINAEIGDQFGHIGPHFVKAYARLFGLAAM